MSLLWHIKVHSQTDSQIQTVAVLLITPENEHKYIYKNLD